MNKKWLTASLLLLIATSSSSKTGAHSELLALRTFDGGVEIGECTVRVDSIRTDDPAVEPKEKVTITCADKTPFYWQADCGLLNLAILFNPSRVVATWECGTGTCVTVFVVNQPVVRRSIVNGKEVDSIEHGGPAARLVFGQDSSSAPDIIFYPDVLLLYRGKFFPPESGRILPKQEDVYIWKEGQYRLQDRYLWNKEMRYEDRFCVLRHDPTCPAKHMDAASPNVE
jgi:hypothetical protein